MALIFHNSPTCSGISLDDKQEISESLSMLGGFSCTVKYNLNYDFKTQLIRTTNVFLNYMCITMSNTCFVNIFAATCPLPNTTVSFYTKFRNVVQKSPRLYRVGARIGFYCSDKKILSGHEIVTCQDT